MNPHEIAPASTSTYTKYPVRRVYSDLGRHFRSHRVPSGLLVGTNTSQERRMGGGRCWRRSMSPPIKYRRCAIGFIVTGICQSVSFGFARGGDVLKHHFPDLAGFEAETPASRRDRLRPHEAARRRARTSVSLPGLLCCADLPVKRPQSGTGSPRATQRPFSTSGDRTSFLWIAMGAGPASATLPCNARDTPAKSCNPVSQRG